MKSILIYVFGGCAGIAAAFFGGWDSALTMVVIAMGVDWVTGGILLPAVFHKSPKSDGGGLESHAGFKGLVRKFVQIMIIGLAYQIDVFMGTTVLKDSVCFAFFANESLSITENCGLMGVPFPQRITDAISVLQGKDKNE